MAITKDSRSEGKKRPPEGGNRIRTHPMGRRQKKARSEGSVPLLSSGLAKDMVKELTNLSRRLNIIFAVSVTADQALRGQNAELDLEIADCLRWMVSDQIADVNQHIRALMGKLGGSKVETSR